MEKFVDRIIETDRKAREIIDAAQQQKQLLREEAKKRAAAQIELLQAQAQKGKAAIDAEFSVREKEISEQLDRAYIDAKHALDQLFNASEDEWLAQIRKNIVSAK